MEEELGSYLPSKKYLNLFSYSHLLSYSLKSSIPPRIKGDRASPTHRSLAGLICPHKHPLLVYSASRVCTHQGGSTSRPTPPLQRQPLPPQYPEPFLLNQNGVPSPGTEGIVSPSQLEGNNQFRQVAQLSTHWHRFSSSWPPAPSSLQLGSGQGGGGVVDSESKRGAFFIRIAFWWNRLILPSLIKK